jgi:nucleotide-binding universal stress UspA family protein
MKALSVLMLRYKQPQNREWKTPLNLNIGGREFPLGLFLITGVLFTLAIINVLTKEVATISGVAFTITFFMVFEFSELYNKRHRKGHSHESEKFRLDAHPDVTKDAVNVRPGNVLVAVRNPNRLQHLDRILRKTDTRKMDIVVLSVRSVKGGSGEHGLEPGQMFAEAETEVFSKVVTLAEKAGKHVELMVVPGNDPYDAAVQTAARLQSSRIVMGLSPKLTPSEQGALVGAYWEKLPEPKPSLSLELVLEDQKDVVFFNLGPHPPRLWPEDIELVHKLWLELKARGPGHKLHHRDIVGVALRRMAAELHSGRAGEVIGDIEEEVASSHL